MRTIAVLNEKGGVGKTSTVATLARALARRSHRVLVIDLDSQMSLSQWLGRDDFDGATMSSVLSEPKAILRAIGPSRTEGVDLLYGDRDVARTAIEVQVSSAAPATTLKRALRHLESGRYDFVLLDCPPGIGLAYVAALSAAGEVLIPVDSHAMALDGATKVYSTIVELSDQGVIDHPLHVRVVLTKWSDRPRLNRAVRDELAATGHLLRSTIRASTRLAECFAQKATIYEYAPAEPVAADYDALAIEMLETPHAQ